MTPDERKETQKHNKERMEQCRKDPVSADCEGLVDILLGDASTEPPINVNFDKYAGKDPSRLH